VFLALLFAAGWRERAPLPLPRAGYAGGVLDSRYVLAGGSFWEGGTKRRTAEVSLYDPAADRWDAGPALPLALSDAASVTVGDSIYVLGGTDGKQERRHVLRLTGRRWTEVPELRLPEPRLNHAAATDGRRIFVIGGLLKGDDVSVTDSVWVCDTEAPRGGWTALPPYPGGRHFLSSAAWLGGLYVIGGARPSSSGVKNLDSVWRLSPETGEWKALPPVPQPRRAAWADADGSRILLFGGYTDRFRSDVLAYSPSSRQWRTSSQLPEGIADAHFLRLGKEWYVSGGEVGPKVRGSKTWALRAP
jgi:N-acetylneuraminic acid mutarotase